MNRPKNTLRAAGLLAILAFSSAALAEIPGETGSSFNLVAESGHISTPDGGSVFTWGYGTDGMQYPGPTLIVTEGDTITISLTNHLPVATSIVFPGQEDVSATGGVPGLLTREAVPNNGTVTYSFTASRPGTFLYQSGTEQDLQIEMGLVGALIVRPSGSADAYGHSSAADNYDEEFLFLLSEMDIQVHQLVEQGLIEWVDTSDYSPEYWFINGRASPDTMEANNVNWLPHQPYNCLPTMHPGQALLMRYVAAGRQLHPFHPHGNHAQLIARDANLLEDEDGNIVGPFLFTVDNVPGQTADAVFTWTGKGLGWDIYGRVGQNPHTCVDGDGDMYDDTTYEWCPDHDVRIPVDLPEKLSLAFGGFWSGSPYLGVMGSLPPGEGGMNPDAGYAYAWHSHTEKELINNDIFPGGMLTFIIITPWPAP